MCVLLAGRKARFLLNQRLNTSLQTSTSTSANMYMALGISNAWDFRKWVDSFRVKVQQKDGLDMKFDMVGIDPAIANAFRRILIAEVPTMAIEHVFYINNTSIITVRPLHPPLCPAWRYWLPWVSYLQQVLLCKSTSARHNLAT